MMKIKILIVGLLALTITSCKKFFEPDPENIRTPENMYNDPAFAQGFVVTAYRSIPAYYNNSDLATDDAVANNPTNDFAQLATGSWTAINTPLSVWNQSYSSIQYLNVFLANSNKVTFAIDPEANKLFNRRMRGEAFGLRGLYMYFLLRNHAGYTPDGQLMGVPIITEFQDILTADFNQPRSTFDACVKQIYRDLDSAIRYLPMEYKDLPAGTPVPDQFASITQNLNVYNRVMGVNNQQLFNGLIARSFKARTALLAASPAFQPVPNLAAWEEAANVAADIIRYKGGINALPANGFTFYNQGTEIDALTNGDNPPEIIWRENRQTNNSDREAQNFPPTLFGNGLTNPTQNLVNAFPMANGYPIDHASSTYNQNDPYAGRDPRLRAYILYNEHPDRPTTRTGSKSGSNDGINVTSTSTRTGYYMRKTLRSDVSLTPGAVTGRNRYNPRLRYTEMYLTYAEAANEAWGPKGPGLNGFSAYDIIKAIRTRAGVGTGNNHAYLEECAADKAKMRELIKNERRLELCFESFRFWDLRRWKENLNETANGMDVNGTVYTPISVESRAFQNFMIYGPIPNSEVLKFNKLTQNSGW